MELLALDRVLEYNNVCVDQKTNSFDIFLVVKER